VLTELAGSADFAARCRDHGVFAVGECPRESLERYEFQNKLQREEYEIVVIDLSLSAFSRELEIGTLRMATFSVVVIDAPFAMMRLDQDGRNSLFNFTQNKFVVVLGGTWTRFFTFIPLDLPDPPLFPNLRLCYYTQDTPLPHYPFHHSDPAYILATEHLHFAASLMNAVNPDFDAFAYHHILKINKSVPRVGDREDWELLQGALDRVMSPRRTMTAEGSPLRENAFVSLCDRYNIVR
jgi:hypothetical protein